MSVDISEDRDEFARDLCGRRCKCDDDATEGCPNWNGERCTWQEFLISCALAAERARGVLEGLRKAHKEEIALLKYLRPSLPVLQSMTTRIGLPNGAAQAADMLAAIDARLSALAQKDWC